MCVFFRTMDVLINVGHCDERLLQWRSHLVHFDDLNFTVADVCRSVGVLDDYWTVTFGPLAFSFHDTPILERIQQCQFDVAELSNPLTLNVFIDELVIRKGWRKGKGKGNGNKGKGKATDLAVRT
jgi:hypothetical protein